MFSGKESKINNCSDLPEKIVLNNRRKGIWDVIRGEIVYGNRDIQRFQKMFYKFIYIWRSGGVGFGIIKRTGSV